MSARAEQMAGAQRPMPRTGPQPATNTPRAAMLDLHKRREIETVLEDLEQALTQLRTTLKATKLDDDKLTPTQRVGVSAIKARTKSGGYRRTIR